MFPGNVLAPSPIYHSMFRAPAVVAQSGAQPFLVDSLLRERQLAQGLLVPHHLLARPLPIPIPHAGSTASPGVHRRSASPSPSPSPPLLRKEHHPREDGDDDVARRSPAKSHQVSSASAAKPYLKFGVHAILSSEISPKSTNHGKICTLYFTKFFIVDGICIIIIFISYSPWYIDRT